MPELEQETDSSQLAAQILDLVIRRRWLIAGTICGIVSATIAVIFQIPNRYTSEATIIIDAQKVSERYVVPTTTSDINQALEAMTHEVLSRPRMLAIIDELGLYTEQKTRLAQEELTSLMRNDLSIEPLIRPRQDTTNAFRISFTASTPQLAQQVTSRLTTLFIEQNLKTRSDQAITTTTFLREQLALTKNKLIEQEQRLRDYKMQFLGELPEQQQGNVSILAGLETQLDNVMANRAQAQQQRMYLESLLNESRRLMRRSLTTGTTGVSSPLASPLEAAQSELNNLKAQKRALLTVYTAQHPDVLKKEQEIKLQQTAIDDLKAAYTAPSSPERQTEVIGDMAGEDIGVAQLKSQLQANVFEMENLAKREQKLRAEIDQYRSRLNLTPVREQQLTSMQRDYELLKQHYGELLKKEQESQLATNLEKRQEGQQFRLADPPNLPAQPSSPKRLRISLIALVAGLVIGCGLAFLADVRSSSFYTEDDVSRKLALPLVIGVPYLFTPTELRGRSWRRAFEWVAGSVLALAIVLAEFYVYRHG